MVIAPMVSSGQIGLLRLLYWHQEHAKPDSGVPVQVSPRRGGGGTTQHPSGRTTTVAPVLEHEELPSPEKEPGWPLTVFARFRTVHSVHFTVHQPALASHHVVHLQVLYCWCALQTVHLRTNQSSG